MSKIKEAVRDLFEDGNNDQVTLMEIVKDHLKEEIGEAVKEGVVTKQELINLIKES